jgi:hypothetical protein
MRGHAGRNGGQPAEQDPGAEAHAISVN